MVENLEQLLIAHLRARLAAPDITGAENLLFFGGGEHTWWLLRAVSEALALPVRGVIDDHKQGWCGTWPVIRIDRAMQMFPAATLVLSSDCHQAEMTTRVRRVVANGPSRASWQLIDLYEGLPGGPYAKQGTGQPKAGREPLVRASERWITRTIVNLASHLKRQSPAPRVLLLGQRWQVDAADAVCTRLGVATTTSVRQATHAVTLDEALEPNRPMARDHGWTTARPDGFDGEVLTLRRGERPWINRRVTASTTVSDQPLRIVLRHDHHLGDVVLSQGILPERIKTELYPRSHITFVTARANPARPRADDTGWCMDLCKHNPFIDRVLASDQVTEEDFAAADLHYTINSSGSLYQHVCDLHAQHVELPPGRTDATIHLSEADRLLAREVIEPLAQRAGLGSPLIGINMGLTLDRFRGWGEAKTLELCARIERELRGVVVWFGWTDFERHHRLMHAGRALSAREQAAVMACCDVHVTNQGGGANMSAAVGCPTLALSGLHPCWREGVAFLNNHTIDDPSRRHVEIWRDEQGLGSNGLAETKYVPWSILGAKSGGSDQTQMQCTEDEQLISRYERELWQRATPVRELCRTEPWWWRTRDVTVDDVMQTLRAMLERSRSSDRTIATARQSRVGHIAAHLAAHGETRIKDELA